MAIAYVQSIGAASSGTSVTTAAITTTSGNLIVAGGGSYNGKSWPAVAISDSKSNTYTRAAINDAADPAATGSCALGEYAYNITGGASHTFTISLATGSDDLAIRVSEFSGSFSTDPLDQTERGGDAGTVTAHTSNTTATTTDANEMLVGVFLTGDTAGASCTGSGGWTTGDYADSGGVDCAIAYRSVTSTGTYNYTTTTATGCRSAMVIMTYKETGGGGGGVSIPIVMHNRLMQGMR